METNPPSIIEDLTLTPIPVWWTEPWVVALALVALGVAGWFLKRSLGRRAPAAEPARAPAGPPPHVAALERLGALRQKLGALSAHELALEASDLLRVYLEARFELGIRYQTTREFLEAAARQPALLSAHRDRLAHFLGACDLSKFAHQNVELAEQRRLLDAAETVIRDSAGLGPGQDGKTRGPEQSGRPA